MIWKGSDASARTPPRRSRPWQSVPPRSQSPGIFRAPLFSFACHHSNQSSWPYPLTRYRVIIYGTYQCRSNDMTIKSMCRPKPRLAARPLLSTTQAGGLERTFKVLANATRLRLLHVLAKRPGLSVTALAETLGMKPQAVSNQLQRLVDKGVLSNIRNGTSVHYRIIDSCIMSLLDQGLCLTEDTWERRSKTLPRSALPTG